MSNLPQPGSTVHLTVDDLEVSQALTLQLYPPVYRAGGKGSSQTGTLHRTTQQAP